MKGKKAKEVAIAVVLVSIQASCRRFRISGYISFTNSLAESAQTDVALSISTRNLTENHLPE